MIEKSPVQKNSVQDLTRLFIRDGDASNISFDTAGITRVVTSETRVCSVDPNAESGDRPDRGFGGDQIVVPCSVDREIDRPGIGVKGEITRISGKADVSGIGRQRGRLEGGVLNVDASGIGLCVQPCGGRVGEGDVSAVAGETAAFRLYVLQKDITDIVSVSIFRSRMEIEPTTVFS